MDFNKPTHMLTFDYESYDMYMAVIALNSVKNTEKFDSEKIMANVRKCNSWKLIRSGQQHSLKTDSYLYIFLVTPEGSSAMDAAQKVPAITCRTNWHILVVNGCAERVPEYRTRKNSDSPWDGSKELQQSKGILHVSDVKILPGWQKGYEPSATRTTAETDAAGPSDEKHPATPVKEEAGAEESQAQLPPPAGVNDAPPPEEEEVPM